MMNFSLQSFKKKFISFLSQEDSIYHLLSYILSSIVLPSLPIIWFIIFMKEKMIFSYDFYTNGMFGLSVFFFFSLVLLLILGFIYVGSIAFFIIYLYQKNNPKDNNSNIKYTLIYLFIINIIMIILTLNHILESQSNIYIYVFIFIFNFFLFIYLGIVYAGKGLHKFIALISFIVVLIWSSVKFHDIISSFIESGLFQFRAGGNIKTEILDKNITLSKGKLLLLTPNKIFIKDDKNNTRIYNRNNIIIKLEDIK